MINWLIYLIWLVNLKFRSHERTWNFELSNKMSKVEKYIFNKNKPTHVSQTVIFNLFKSHKFHSTSCPKCREFPISMDRLTSTQGHFENDVEK